MTPTHAVAPREWPLAIQAAVVVAISVMAGLAANSFEARRIPWQADATVLAETQARRRGVSTIDPAAAIEDWRAGRSLWLDVRPAADYARGHVPWALPLPAATLAAQGPAAVPTAEHDRPLIVYCQGPTCDDGLHAALRLQSMGFRAVRLFVGGLASWRASGMDVEQGESSADGPSTP